MRRGFTLIELLVICAILATMVSIGVGSIVSGQSMARVKGATRDVYAAIRHARSTALVTGQRVLVNYSNGKTDDEVALKIEVVAAKVMSADGNRTKAQPYYVMDYKDLPTQKTATAPSSSSSCSLSSSNGETLEEILFSPMGDSVVTGMRILVKKGEESLADETVAQTRSRLSVFSSVDYLLGRYQASKTEAAEVDSTFQPDIANRGSSSGSVNDMNGTVSVVWETNGAVEPHRIWIYPDGKKPEDGLMLNIDSFGAVKVLSGDAREED